jgi:hypothetical protein
LRTIYVNEFQWAVFRGTQVAAQQGFEIASGFLVSLAVPWSNVLRVIYHVLYGGTDDNVPERLWEAISVDAWRIEHFGISALGELVGWALPERYPPRNNRTSKSLRSLGFPVIAHG